MGDPTAARGWRRLGTLPVAATAITAIGAVYTFLVALGNITDFDTNQAFVQAVLSMETTFNDPDLMWRAVTNRTAQNVAYVAIIVWESVTAAVLAWATWSWLRAGSGGAFGHARQLSTIGFTMMLLLFGGGFIAIGGEWFAMWQSEQWNGLAPAIQNFTISAFGLVLVHLPSREWDPRPADGVVDDRALR